jgi:hypothetical protein
MAECDLACKTKIIINGGNAARLLDVACTAIEYMDAREIEHGEEIIKILNRMEDDAVKVQKLILKGVGYDGPTGKMLE